MIESDQKLLFTHEIATCQFFISDAVGKKKKNKSSRFDLGTRENPRINLHTYDDYAKVFLRNWFVMANFKLPSFGC